MREREAYFRLMQQGVSNTEACRIVGINRRTGKRWRYGRNASGSNKAAPPINAVEPPSLAGRDLWES
ncbi:helix-turn-helix domain-containing protein, partial [Streptomyces hygroscopicus]